jgi:hypothetical protein
MITWRAIDQEIEELRDAGHPRDRGVFPANIHRRGTPERRVSGVSRFTDSSIGVVLDCGQMAG